VEILGFLSKNVEKKLFIEKIKPSKNIFLVLRSNLKLNICMYLESAQRVDKLSFKKIMKNNPG
jgi:hypothetical protein